MPDAGFLKLRCDLVAMLSFRASNVSFRAIGIAYILISALDRLYFERRYLSLSFNLPLQILFPFYELA